ncbi:MAG: GNAT family N-acetyltransferase [Flavobacteriales bacterium]|nr:GNAT family N-acetyltransferase [Flavobacteriales bacterium]
METTQLNPQITAELETFYQIGHHLRNEMYAIEIPWTESKDLDQWLKNPGMEFQFWTISEGEKQGRIAAYFIKGEQLGQLGWYECSDHDDVSSNLFDQACNWLKQHGCTTVLGPVNGSSWGNYRLNKTSEYPILPGDPYQPLFYVNQWQKAGFIEKYNYNSRLAPKSLIQPTSMEEAQQLAGQYGIKIHRIPETPSPELERKLYDFYNLCFDSNPLFQPLKYEDYQAFSNKANSICDRDHSFYLMNEEGTIIFVIICYLDVYHFAEQNGQLKGNNYPHKNLLIKTIATHPEWRGKQIGTMMINLVHQLADNHGCAAFYHLLMFDDNLSSTKGKEKFQTEIIREYTLMEKTL